MLTMAHQTLTSWHEAQTEVGRILANLNADPSLLLAAAANPMFALQELGYEVHAEVRQEFEDRIRFGDSRAEKLNSLRESVFKLAGRTFDLQSSSELHEVLLDLFRASHKKREENLTPADVQPIIPRIMSRDKLLDPLERFRGSHPAMEPLLQYRALEATTPRFATREVYDEIREGKRPVPFTKIVARLKRAPRSSPGEK